MAKTVKHKPAASKAKVTKAQLLPPKPDTSELKLLLIDLEGFVQGSGTNEDRQKAVDKLKEIIQKFEA